ncbi:MAG: peptidoglycan DD-metalloendopeptidase family protein [Pseudomonadota bacterium]
MLGASNPQPLALQPIESRDLAPATVAPGPQVNTTASLKAQGYTLENAPIVEVGEADTAASLAAGFGVPPRVIFEANGLSGPLDVKPGMRLVIPKKTDLAQTASADPNVVTTVTRFGQSGAPEPLAPTLGAPAVSLDAQAGEGRHVVQPGDTLWSIASAHRVTPEAVARLNGLPSNSTVKLGTTLRIPKPSLSAPAAAPAKVASIAPTITTDPMPTDALPTEVVRDDTALPQPSKTQKPAPTVTAKAPATKGFSWPVQGRIIAGFGKQPDGARNDGINLSVPAGTPVRAAKGGTVIYAGNELEGYGNLILVQHENDWVSAYAHNETLKVSRGDTVTKGQAIASVGKTGSVEKPQLHFELRKKSTPVDPLPHLSGA